MFKFFKKTCPICDMEVAKNTPFKAGGSYFCSEDHMNTFLAEVEKGESKSCSSEGGGGCCGEK